MSDLKTIPPIANDSDFAAAFTDLIVTRIVGANAGNEFSRRLEGNLADGRFHARELFERMVEFVQKRDRASRKNLFLQLCYLKPESPTFAAGATEGLRGLENGVHSVSEEFAAYIRRTIQPMGANCASLSPAAHFSGTTVVTMAGETLQCRKAVSQDVREGRVYCGCSTADSLLFDERQYPFEAFVTFPGLSIRHVHFDFLVATYQKVVKALLPRTRGTLRITICVGFVDKLKIAGAIDEWDHAELESLVGAGIEAALAAITEANRALAGKVEFELYPGAFPIAPVSGTTVNGVVPFHPANVERSRIVDEALNSEARPNDFLFPTGGFFSRDLLIHDREIHPRLGINLSGFQLER